MRLSDKVLKQRFDKFNQKYFNGELFEPKFVKTGSRWTAGMFNCDVYVATYDDGSRHMSMLKDIKIMLSKYLIKNSRILDNILLHEMIHYYGYQMDKDIKGSHGRFFKRMANKINKDGYNVQTYYRED